MPIDGKTIGFALTGSFCTLQKALEQMDILCQMGARVIPIVSFHVYEMDTRFFRRDDLLSRMTRITGESVIHTIQGAEPIGPERMLDLLVVAPCTGNTLAKFVHGITDTPVLMAAKAQLRCGRPVLLAVCTNDGLGLNARNIGTAATLRQVYLVPYGQDDAAGKPNSLVADMTLLPRACDAALEGNNLTPQHLPPAGAVLA